MRTTLELIIRLLTTTATKWWDDNPWRLSAALSYYTLFSLAPLLTLAVAVATVVVDERVVQGELLRQLEDLIGEHGANAMTPMLHTAGHPVHGTVATLISFITLFIVSMGMFSELQDALNFIWRIPCRVRSSALLGTAQNPTLLIFAGHRDRVPSDRRLGPERRYGRCGDIHSERDVRATGLDDGDRHHGITPCNGRAVHAHVQNATGRTYRLAGCLDWRNCYCRAVYVGTVGDRNLPARARDDIHVRGRLFTDGNLGVGILLCLDFLSWS